MKKILILGAYNTEIEIIQTSKKMGLYTICTDSHSNWIDAPAKYLADEAWDVSWTDYDSLVQKCIERKVDGIMAGFSEQKVFAARQLSALLHFPFYANDADLDAIQNKSAFKNACKKCGIVVPKPFSPSDKSIEYPVIVKPADNGGSRGITICHNEEELNRACSKAIENSYSGEIVVEQYLTGDEVMIYFNVYNGVPVLSSMCDRLMKSFDKNITQLPIGYYFNSRHINTFLNFNLSKYCELIKSLGIRNGLIAFQSFVVGRDIIPFDPTFRLDGTMAYMATKNNSGVSSLENLIHYSMGDFEVFNEAQSKERPIFSKVYFELPILLTQGTIKTIVGLDSVSRMDCVYFIFVAKKVGDTMADKVSFSQIFCRIQMCCRDNAELKDSVKRIFDMIHIFDDEGKDLVIYRGDDLFDE